MVAHQLGIGVGGGDRALNLHARRPRLGVTPGKAENRMESFHHFSDYTTQLHGDASGLAIGFVDLHFGFTTLCPVLIWLLGNWQI